MILLLRNDDIFFISVPSSCRVRRIKKKGLLRLKKMGAAFRARTLILSLSNYEKRNAFLFDFLRAQNIERLIIILHFRLFEASYLPMFWLKNASLLWKIGSYSIYIYFFLTCFCFWNYHIIRTYRHDIFLCFWNVRIWVTKCEFNLTLRSRISFKICLH